MVIYFLALELIEFSTSSDSKLKKLTRVYLRSFTNKQTSDTSSENEWQQVTASRTTSENEWLRVTMNDNQ